MGAGAPDLCETNATYRHVCGGYRGFARRNPTTDELEYWALKNPFPRTQFNSVLGHSLGSRRSTIRGYYDYFADSEPDPAGLTYWEGQVLEVNGLRRLAAALLANKPGTIDGFLSRTFGSELGREPTVEEQTYWGTRTVTTTRTKVAAEVSATTEARRAKVTWTYKHELGYLPDTGSRDYWAERLRTGTSYLEMRIVLKYSRLETSGFCTTAAPVLDDITC